MKKKAKEILPGGMVNNNKGQHAAANVKMCYTRTTTRMNLENIVPSERSQSQKASYCVIPSLGKPRTGELQRRKGAGGAGSDC